MYQTASHYNFVWQTISAVRCGLLTFFAVLSFFAIAWAQENQPTVAPVKNPAQEQLTIEDVYDGDLFSLNKDVVIKGSVTKGVLSFGGNVIVEGRVEGDVAAFGGTVYQRPGSFIGGDVIIIGGGYNHGKVAPGRNPNTQTIMYAGYENELREAIQNPSSLLAPSFSAAFFVQRIISVLFWFLVSLVLTTISPGAVSRAIARLNLSNIRVAAIGGLAIVIITLGIGLGISFLPTPIGVVVSLMATALLFLAYVFGRVVVQAATGKYLYKLIFKDRKPSDSIALLLGSIFWTAVLSLPFVWAAVLVGLLVVSLGLVLTARPSLGRKIEI